jgi:hypothetical protein
MSATATIICSLTVVLETDSGKRPSKSQLGEARAALEEAIRNRIFGDGVLPDDLLLKSWDISFQAGKGGQ